MVPDPEDRGKSTDYKEVTVKEIDGPQAVADYLNLPLATLYAWKSQGTGPRVSKVGKHLRYRKSDVDAWLEQQAEPGSA
jgi:excisionase family DNA binding protein